jgi:hypothetical protein
MVGFLGILLLVLIGLVAVAKESTNSPHSIDYGLDEPDEPSGEPYVADKSEGSVTSQRDKMRELFQECASDEERTVSAYAAAERAGQVFRRSNDYELNPEEYARRLFADGIRKGWIE